MRVWDDLMKEVKPLPEEALAEGCQILAMEPLLPLIWFAVKNNCFSVETSKEIYDQLTEVLEQDIYGDKLLQFFDVIGLTNEVIDRYDAEAEKESKAYNEYLIFMRGPETEEEETISSNYWEE